MKNSRALWWGAGALAAGAGLAMMRRTERMSLAGKVVLITGGSRGLGLALARRFAGEGARLALCARGGHGLDVARQNLTSTGAEVFTVPCDVADPEQVRHMIASTLREYGRIDVLVNNAGVIHVGPVHEMTLDDFETAMAVMFWGHVYTTMTVLPHMKERHSGRIVNITSIGAKVSVPHLVPYSCAKFAAAAFSEGMRAELQNTGIKVVTIAPGLMRTGSYLNAVFKGNAEAEARWFSAGASLPGISISATRAARQIVEATALGSSERILSMPANLLALFHGMFPGTTADVMGLVNRMLPRGGGEVETGAQSAALRTTVMRAVTTLGRKAAAQYLQPASNS
jgi:NAD(P)-dependent dehydrogenase (short-subunit alcohol dehydrogenase family)